MASWQAIIFLITNPIFLITEDQVHRRKFSSTSNPHCNLNRRWICWSTIFYHNIGYLMSKIDHKYNWPGKQRKSPVNDLKRSYHQISLFVYWAPKQTRLQSLEWYHTCQQDELTLPQQSDTHFDIRVLLSPSRWHTTTTISSLIIKSLAVTRLTPQLAHSNFTQHTIPPNTLPLCRSPLQTRQMTWAGVVYKSALDLNGC